MNKLKDFEYNGKTIKLKKPLPLKKSEYNEIISLINDDIEIYGIGYTEESAYQNVRDIFSRRYEEALKIMGLIE